MLLVTCCFPNQGRLAHVYKKKFQQETCINCCLKKYILEWPCKCENDGVLFFFLGDSPTKRVKEAIYSGKGVQCRRVARGSRKLRTQSMFVLRFPFCCFTK